MSNVRSAYAHLVARWGLVMFASVKWQDWANAVLGLWLLASPWTFGFADQQGLMMNAVVFGFVLMVFSLLDLSGAENAKEWIIMAAGLWLLVAPFALGFTPNFHAAVNTMLVGVLAAVFAAWAAALDKEISSWWHDHITGH